VFGSWLGAIKERKKKYIGSCVCVLGRKRKREKDKRDNEK
jgi:hypothetical protein